MCKETCTKGVGSFFFCGLIETITKRLHTCYISLS